MKKKVTATALVIGFLLLLNEPDPTHTQALVLKDFALNGIGLLLIATSIVFGIAKESEEMSEK